MKKGFLIFKIEIEISIDILCIYSGQKEQNWDLR